jgi:hypothetical protein
MSEEKFTPGPWSVPHFAKTNVKCECGYVLVDSLMGSVATVNSSCGGDWRQHGDDPSKEQCVANANLIAAAPDLFEALQLAITRMAHSKHECLPLLPTEQWSKENGNRSDKCCCEIAVVRKALAKALGKEAL